MNEMSNTEKEIQQPKFYTTIPNSSDEELLVILKRRKQYQLEAAQVAIKEAIKRGLIHSEQDLFSDKYEQSTSGYSFFPVIENERARNKTRRSIARVFLLAGAMPVIWGAIKIIGDLFFEGVLLVVLGLVWMFVSWKQFEEVDVKRINLLSLLLIVAVAYIARIIAGLQNPVFMDYFIPSLLILIFIYGLVFMRRLKY
jgi:hypothetical protein